MEETIQTKEAAAAAPPADDVGATAPADSCPTRHASCPARARARPARPQAPWQTTWFQEQTQTQARSPSHSPRRSSRGRTPCCCCSRPCSRARARGTRGSPDDAGPDARCSPALARRPLRRAADAKHNGSLSIKAPCRASSRATSS